MSNTTKTAAERKEKLTINYLLNQIEQIVKDNEYIHNALEQLALMPKSDHVDIAGREKGKAIGEIVRCRETTNQQALRLYEKMYDDLSSQQKTNEVNKIKCDNVVSNKMIAHSNENGKSVISISNDAHYYIWELVSGWPDIISNEENLKIIADLNMTNTEIMEITTNILYQIFHRIDRDREVIIRIENTSIEKN